MMSPGDRLTVPGDRASQADGLCSTCVHAERVISSRSSTFLLCKRSAFEPEFPKYPRLPVQSCRGYER
jgi:hypothetical protein